MCYQGVQFNVTFIMLLNIALRGGGGGGGWVSNFQEKVLANT